MTPHSKPGPGNDLAVRFRRRYDQHFRGRPTVPFGIMTTDGYVHTVGTTDPDAARFLVIVRDVVGYRALRSLDDLRIGVAFMRGHLDISGDFAAALRIRSLLSDIHPLAFLGRWATRLTIGRLAYDRRSISRHYDEDSDFFLTFLDQRHRCYTQGLFMHDDEPLEAAMTHKMDYALAALAIGPGDHVLDVGGGWGAFAEYAARKGINVTTITLSDESARFLYRFFADKDLPVRVVQAHLLTYSADRPFDALVNMGVTEHLPDYQATLRAYARLVRPGGRIYLDAFAMRHRYHLSTFFKSHVSPGNSAPLVLHSYLRHVAHSPFELLRVLDDRHNYYLTCREWARRLDERSDEIVQTWGSDLYRRFRLFLWGSAVGFETGRLQAYRWVLRNRG
jgi:cyclopropane-fatty-acyl-phospholipid synthase